MMSLAATSAHAAGRPARGTAARAVAARDQAPLDPPYRNLRRPMVVPPGRDGAPDHSPVGRMIQMQTPVRAQGSRGTCSIFSATALLESLLVARGLAKTDLDLSEQWLNYVTATLQGSTDDGSNSYTNFQAISTYGMASEKAWAYNAESWLTGSSPAAQEQCGHIRDDNQKVCLVAQRDPRLLNASDMELRALDPDLLQARTQAKTFRERTLLRRLGRASVVYSTAEVKDLLNQGVAVTLDLDFYYGAWNHRVATNLGLNRDMEAWELGVVGYPEAGSMDRKKSPSQPAGHSVVVVGYDDNKVVRTKVLMADGSVREFTRKGVYYFKNSWGTQSFGVRFAVDGAPAPGYGMITQDYAHEFGSFFKVQMR